MLAGATSAVRPAEPELSALYGKCFAQNFSEPHLAIHPAQRVAAIAIQFQGLENDLLASVLYSLRYGTRFGLSADCYVKTEGGLLCTACTNGSCDVGGESFKLFWSGGENVELVNDTTGILAANIEGGRDYLRAAGGDAYFVLTRVAAEKCAW